MNTKLNVVVLRINKETGVTENVSMGYAINRIGCLWNNAEELLLQGYSLNFYPYSYKLKQDEQ